MAATLDSAKRIMNGTWGEIWVEGVKVAECSAFQAKVARNKEKLNLCGKFMSDTKANSADGTGSVTIYHVDSAHLTEESGIQNGIDRRYTIVSKLRDPDSFGAERVALYGVSFDDMTLADWKAATTGSITRPFTFNSFELLDTITAP